MWIAFTLSAAWFQSMRTAYQNTLSKQQGFLHATLARSLFGLPFVILYCTFCWFAFGEVWLPNSFLFYAIAFIGAIAQVIATYLMLRLFSLTSFTSGTLFAKTEAMLTAILAVVFLQDGSLSFSAWSAIFAGVIGICILSVARNKEKFSFLNMSSLLGLICGLVFALTSVSVSYSSGLLEGPFATRAAFTLTYVLFIQTLLLWGIQAYKTKSFCYALQHAFKLNCKVGFLSAVGSIGWFTAFSLAHPALVKTLGQIEVLGTLYYSKYRFKEELALKEIIGGGLIIFSIIAILLF